MDKIAVSLIIAEHFGELSAALWPAAGEPLTFRADMDVSKGGPFTITTGWAKPAKVITVDFTQKWLLAIGNLVYQ